MSQIDRMLLIDELTDEIRQRLRRLEGLTIHGSMLAAVDATLCDAIEEVGQTEAARLISCSSLSRRGWRVTTCVFKRWDEVEMPTEIVLMHDNGAGAVFHISGVKPGHPARVPEGENRLSRPTRPTEDRR